MNTLKFDYELKSEITIRALNTKGLIVGYFYGENGMQYQVTYFVDGERKTTYLYPEEIMLPTGHESAGFLK